MSLKLLILYWTSAYYKFNIKLIYCGSRNSNNELITFRYTQNQRRLETRKKKYSKIIDTVNKNTTLGVNNKTIKEIEAKLSKQNSKSCNYEKFKEYCSEKNKTNNLLFKHYEQSFFRKLLNIKNLRFLIFSTK